MSLTATISGETERKGEEKTTYCSRRRSIWISTCSRIHGSRKTFVNKQTRSRDVRFAFSCDLKPPNRDDFWKGCSSWLISLSVDGTEGPLLWEGIPTIGLKTQIDSLHPLNDILCPGETRGCVEDFGSDTKHISVHICLPVSGSSSEWGHPCIVRDSTYASD